jgi:protoheme IX farnesyltransferase
MSSTLSRVDGRRPVFAPGWRGILNDYYELAKPRIVYLLLITTLAAMIMAAHGLPPLELTLATLVGGAFAAGSAGAFNCVIDRDIDRLMARTALRPVARGSIAPFPAVVYASVLGILAFGILYAFVNPLAAWLSLAGNAYYVFVYTLWLKRSTVLNIVIGGAAGSVPPLVGWAAVTGHIGWPAVGLFAVIFLWTPPHFWALALMTNTDYARANVPMLPNVFGAQRTKLEIFIYSALLVGASLALTPLGVFGLWYFVPAAACGAIFMWDAWKLWRGPGAMKTNARALFKYSLLYLALMCAAMVLDRVVG